NNGLFECIERAPGCPRDVYELMVECWRRDELDRPTFAELLSLLQRKTATYSS
ncbi:jg18409, partial [Pararge aegeria aegeria]